MTNAPSSAERQANRPASSFSFGSIVIFYLAIVVWYPGLFVSTFVFIPELHELDLFEDTEGIFPTTGELLNKFFGPEIAANAQTTEQKWTWYWGLVGVCSLA